MKCDDDNDCLRSSGDLTGAGHPLPLFEALLGAGGGEPWCARSVDGRIAAGGLFVSAARPCDYWQRALLKERTHMRSANALGHELIVEVRQRGCAYSNFKP